MKRILAVIAAATLLGATTVQAQGDALAHRVDSLFAHLDTTPSPGVAIAVVRDGRVLLSRGYGMADLEHGVRITPATVFDVASVSKQFAGLAIAMLARTDEFTSANPFFRAVTFLRDGAGKVTGLSVHAGPRSRDNRFPRVDP